MNGTSSKKTELSERDNKPRTYRRIVTGNVNGKAVVQSDGSLPAYEFRTVPGYEHTLIWVNPATPDLSKEQRFDSYPDSVVPGTGLSRIALAYLKRIHLGCYWLTGCRGRISYAVPESSLKLARATRLESVTSRVTGRRAQPSAWTNSPKNSDGCRVPGTRSQERTIDCRGWI